MTNQKNDFFISCSTEGSVESKKWLEEFITLFSILADKIRKTKNTIISSFDLEKGNELSKIAPVDIFKNTNIFIVIVDNDYSNSTKSSQELATIYSAIQSQETKVLDKSNRVFKLLTGDVIKEKQPSQLQDLLSYNFFETEKQRSIPINFSILDKFDTHKKYWLRLIDLIYNASDLITERNKLLKSKKTVFLAETGRDQQTNREIIKRELLHYGYNVLPDISLPDELERLKSYIQECLKYSEISIHIFGSDEGKLIGKNDKIVVLQNNIASDFSSNDTSKLKRLIWLPPDIVFEHENQRISIEKLKRDSQALIGAELIQTPIEEFKSILHRHLNTQIDNKESENQKKNIYLIDNYNHFENLDSISNELANNDFKVIKLEPTESNINLLSNHRKHLVACDGVLIFYDGKNENWVRSKKNDILKSIAFGRTEPIAAKAIYLSDKAKLDEDEYSGFDIIDGSEDISKDVIKTFIEKLKQ